MLGIYSSYVASILRVPSYLYIVCTRIYDFPKTIKEYALLVYFLGTFRTLGGSEAHEHLGMPGFTLGKAKPPSGATTGGTPERPQKSPTFFRKKTSVSKLLVHLEKMDARHKQLRYGAGRAVGPPTPPEYGTPLTTSHLSRL